MIRNWQEYYQQTKNKPPSPLLTKALDFVVNKNTALDLGAGALQDSRYLLKQGFKSVTAVDKEQIPAEILNGLSNENFKFVCLPFEQFKFAVHRYDLVNAQYSLPFNGPETFDQLFKKVKNSLNHQGVFVGQLFGNRDEWSSKNADIIFYTKKGVEDLLKDMEVMECVEVEKEEKLANGNPKHWHIFHIIAKQNN